MTDEFWKRKSLAGMSSQEWESLCDGCALCCLQKLEDGRCIDYPTRAKKVASCLVLSVDSPEAFAWLPATCAYRLLADGNDLPEWHPLVTGDPDSVHAAGISATDKAVSETETTQWTVLRKLGE